MMMKCTACRHHSFVKMNIDPEELTEDQKQEIKKSGAHLMPINTGCIVFRCSKHPILKYLFSGCSKFEDLNFYKQCTNARMKPGTTAQKVDEDAK